MPDTQKSEVRQDEPEQDAQEMFCRDCSEYDEYSYEDEGYCFHHEMDVLGDAIRRCFVRRPA